MALANRSIGYDEVEARDLRFNLDKDSVPRYWMNNDPWSTSFFNSILAAVPDGERWVMQCVRQSLTRLQDESVRKAGIAFIKQEHYHAREHDDMNKAFRSTWWSAASSASAGPWSGSRRRTCTCP